MRRGIAALIMCLCIAGCADYAAAPSTKPERSCGTGSGHCQDAGPRTVAGVARDAGAPHDFAILHYAGDPQAARGADDDSGAQDVDAGDPLLSVTFNLKAFNDCSFAASSLLSYPTGLYDIGTPDSCVHPYTTHLLVRSTWQSVDPGDQVLEVDRATITLRARGTPIQFGVDQLPNPFEAMTHLSLASAVAGESLGVAACEVIPVAYAHALQIFTGKSITASIQLYAVTSSGELIEAVPFDYPIKICESCLTICASMLEGTDSCDDATGNADHSCVDHSC